MLILAIDTALDACAAAVLDTDTSQLIAQESQAMKRGHAEALMPLIERVMAGYEGGFARLSRIAVTVGPGSFTGLRVGLSAARAIGLATGKPVIGVSTLAAYCAGLMGREAGRATAAAIDARHGSVYLMALAAGGGIQVQAQQCLIKDAVRMVGSGPLSLAGSGATLLAQEAWSLGLDAVVVDASAAPDIRWVARLGAVADPDTALPKPLYLRAPDAHPQDNGKLARL